MDVLNKYSKENGYSIILDTSSQQTPVLYAANQIDVTQDIIRLYDQSYPVKAAHHRDPRQTRAETRHSCYSETVASCAVVNFKKPFRLKPGRPFSFWSARSPLIH